MSAQAHFNQQVQALDHYLYKIQGAYRDPTRTRNDIIECLRTNPALQPRIAPLANKPGAGQVVYLAGTIPVMYNGVQYNIPVSIWVVDAYPHAPPVAYVTPTPDMIVKPKHRHVDSAGMTYLPYLSSWNARTSNLRDLVATMCKVFGDDPPVRAKPKDMPPPSTSPDMAGSSFEDPGTVIRRNAVAAVTEKLRRELRATYERLASEIDALMSNASAGDPRQRKQSQIKACKAEIESVTAKYEELCRWLAANDKGGAVDIDAITEPRDALSKQLLHLVATDAALEDTLYFLEKGMLAGSVKSADFLKTYRSTSREQFMKRATMKKVHEVQRALKAEAK